jgi:hypothetical protein
MGVRQRSRISSTSASIRQRLVAVDAAHQQLIIRGVGVAARCHNRERHASRSRARPAAARLTRPLPRRPVCKTATRSCAPRGRGRLRSGSSAGAISGGPLMRRSYLRLSSRARPRSTHPAGPPTASGPDRLTARDTLSMPPPHSYPACRLCLRHILRLTPSKASLPLRSANASHRGTQLHHWCLVYAYTSPVAQRRSAGAPCPLPPTRIQASSDREVGAGWWSSAPTRRGASRWSCSRHSRARGERRRPRRVRGRSARRVRPAARQRQSSCGSSAP